MRKFPILTLAVLPLVSSAKTVADYSAASEKANVQLTVPAFPASTDTIKSTIDSLIVDFGKRGDAIANSKSTPSFASTIGALDGLYALAWDILSPVEIVENASPNADLRRSATEHLQRFREFEVTFSFRTDIYDAVKAYADTNPQLTGESTRLLEETLRDYRRKGFGLTKEKRTQVEALQKELSKSTTAFATNIREIQVSEKFTAAELEGLPDSLLSQPGLKNADGTYTLPANIAHYYINVLDYAKNADTRRRMMLARSKHANTENLPILKDVLSTRIRVANLLGYATWADYKTETRMSGSQQNVRDFLYNLHERLAPKAEAEIAVLQKLKARETGDPAAVIESWDVRYYQNILMKESYNIDTEALRVFFPYEETLAGMFKVYSLIFGITIEQIENPAPWAEGVTLNSITDTATGKPLGLFYLDMFPREGKYNHFAQFGIISGRQLQEADAPYQRATVALMCNFPPPSPGSPSLLSMDNVETLFHEFGHCLHSILSEANFSQFSGTSVPRDFVESPSQVLEYWVKRKEVLDLFAADYRDPSKKIPAETLANLEKSAQATIGMHYKRQLGYGLTDLNLHSYLSPEQIGNPGDVGNSVMAKVYFPQPEDTAFVTSFGHLMGYDAGYYGYAWADVISADLASVFENNNAFLNPELGRKLRDEIFATGHSRPIDDSIEAFLGRPRNFDAFVKKLGLN
ncbi:MAG: Zn-dependent oligopeptidase [Verrucomicrobiales bacterium]|nr:Zn-dependent oligopeptidase [Verrucomicrobiales bacterium]